MNAAGDGKRPSQSGNRISMRLSEKGNGKDARTSDKGKKPAAKRTSQGGTQLFQALAADPENQKLLVVEKDLLNVGYREVQKKAWQQKKEDELFDRISRRVVVGRNVPNLDGSVRASPARSSALMQEVKPLAPTDSVRLVSRLAAGSGDGGTKLASPVNSPRQPTGQQAASAGLQVPPALAARASDAVPPVGIDSAIQPAPASPAPGAAHDGAAAATPMTMVHQGRIEEEGVDAYGDLKQYSQLRRLCILISTNPDFELLVVLAIFANCVTLSLYDPLQPESSSWNRGIFWADLTLNVVYTIEMVLRIMAIGPPWVLAYLNHPWNFFDASMVAIGYTAFIPTDAGGGNTNAIRALRALRALRPLRTITRFESLRGVIVCFMEAVPLLLSVAGILILFLFLFSIAAVQMFTSTYHNICMGVDAGSGQLMAEVDIKAAQGIVVDDFSMYGCSGQLDGRVDKFWESLRMCPDNMTCVTTASSTANNTAGWDNTAQAMLTNFQCLTLTSWAHVMYRTMDSTSPFAVLYFTVLIVFGAYFVLQLFLAVLKTKFAKAQSIFAVKQQNQAKEKRKNTLASMFFKAKTKLSAVVSKHSRKSILSSQLHSVLNDRCSMIGRDDYAHDKPRDQLNTAAWAGARPAKINFPVPELSAPERPSDTTATPVEAMHQAPEPEASNHGADLALRTQSMTAQASFHAAGSVAPSDEPSIRGQLSLRKGSMTQQMPLKSALVSDKTGESMSRSFTSKLFGRYSKQSEQTASIRSRKSRTSVKFQAAVTIDEFPTLVDTDAEPEEEEVGSQPRAVAEGRQSRHVFQNPIFESDALQPPPRHHPRGPVAEGSEDRPLLNGPAQQPAEPAATNDKAGANMVSDAAQRAADNEDAPLGMVADSVAMAMLSVQEFDEIVADMPWRVRWWLRLQFRLRKMAEQQAFDNFFLVLITISTVLLATEYDGMSDGLMTVLWDANLALNVIFTVEIMIKLLGLGFWEYVKDGFNIFDFLIVTLCWIEIVIVEIAGSGALRSMRALRILRAIRVLRLLKVFKYLEGLRKIAEVLVNSFASFFAIVILLMLFWLVFTIMGLHVFGGLELLQPNVYPNFDTFLNSMLSTFNILNLENWNQQMYSVIAANNWGTAAYYLIWIVIGKYTLLALFLAVMLEAYEAKYDPGALRGGGFGSRASGMLSSLRSKLSSIAQSVMSSRHSRDSFFEGKKERGNSLDVQQTPSFNKGIAANPGRSQQGGSQGAGGMALLADHPKLAVEQQQDSALNTQSSKIPTAPATEDPSAADSHAHHGQQRQSAAGPRPLGEATETESTPAVGTRRSRGSSYLAPVSAEKHDWQAGGSQEPRPPPQPRIPDPRAPPPAPKDPFEELMADTSSLNALLSIGQRATTPVLHGRRVSAAPAEGQEIPMSPQPPSQPPDASGRRRMPREASPGDQQGNNSFASESKPPPTEGYTPRPPDERSARRRPAHLDGQRPASRQVDLESKASLQPAMTPVAPTIARPGYSTVSPDAVRSLYMMTTPELNASTTPAAEPSMVPAAQQPTVADPQAAVEAAVMQLPSVFHTAALGHDSPQAGLDPRASQAHSQGRRMSQQNSTTTGKSRRVSVEMARWLVEQTSAEAPLEQPSPAPVSPSGVGSTASGPDDLPTKPSVQGPKPRPPSSAPPGLESGVSLTHDMLKQHHRRTSVDLTVVEMKARTAGDQLAVHTGLQEDSSHNALDPLEAAAHHHKKPGRHKGKHPTGMQLPAVPKPLAGGPDFSGKYRAPSMTGSEADPNASGKFRDRNSTQSRQGADSSFQNRSRKKLTPEEAFKERQRKRNGAIMIEGSGQSFWYFDEDHPVRVWVYDRITTKWYDYVMFIIITFNCLQMAIEGPYIASGSVLDQALYWSDIGFTIVFGIEVLVKSFAFTFHLYIKDGPNQVDFLIVCVSVLVLALQAISTSAQIATALRVLRAIKPLRLLTRSEGMRIVFKSLMLSLAAMGNVSLVCVMFFLIFAILGTQLFMGLFWSCNDTTVSGVSECVGEYVVDPVYNITAAREWKNSFPNFDNVGNSLLICFITATLNGYTSIMIQAMSAPQQKGQQPQMNINPGAFFWFVGFVFVCAFTLINLYVGVIFSQFSKIRLQSTTGSAFLTSQQQEWAELSKMVFKLKPGEKTQSPRNPFRRFAHWLTDNSNFEIFMLAVAIANIACMAATYYDMPFSLIRAMQKANYFFVAMYISEMLLKLLAKGWAGYWKDGWNRFDVFLVLTAVLDLAISALQMNFLRVLRVLRTQKLLKVFRSTHMSRLNKAAQNFRSLFTTLVAAMPAFGNVGSLIGLIFFMYGYVGVYLFGTLRFNIGINEHANFGNFLSAELVLLRVATGDNWSNILMDCIPQQNCDKEQYNCGTWAALPYFLSFVLIVSVILLNLFTAVVVETFEKIHEQDEWKLSPRALEEFSQLWSEYDDGSGTILPRHLEELLMRVDPPLGLGSMADNKDVLRFVYDLDIPLLDGRVPFHKTIFELVKRVSQSEIPEGALKEQLDRLIDKFFRDLRSEDALNFSAAVSVGRVQRNWRARTRAAKVKRKRQWRSQRDGAPNYSTLCQDKDYLIEAYQLLKEAERKVFQEAGGTGPFSSRWRFNPALLPWAAEFERSAGIFDNRTLKNIMTFNWKGNKVTAADRVTGLRMASNTSRLGPRVSEDRTSNGTSNGFFARRRASRTEPLSPTERPSGGIFGRRAGSITNMGTPGTDRPSGTGFLGRLLDGVDDLVRPFTSRMSQPSGCSDDGQQKSVPSQPPSIMEETSEVMNEEAKPIPLPPCE